VHEPPEEIGINAPVLVEDCLEETYGVEYLSTSCWRLLKEPGLRYRKTRHPAVETINPTERRFRMASKKQREVDATVVCIGQEIRLIEPGAAWHVVEGRTIRTT
jgi:hypothetical protein